MHRSGLRAPFATGEPRLMLAGGVENPMSAPPPFVGWGKPTPLQPCSRKSFDTNHLAGRFVNPLFEKNKYGMTPMPEHCRRTCAADFQHFHRAEPRLPFCPAAVNSARAAAQQRGVVV